MFKEIFNLKEKLEQSEYIVYSTTFQRDYKSNEVSVDIHLENDSFIKYLRDNKYTIKHLGYEVWDSVSSEPACLYLPLFDKVTLKALWGKDELITQLRKKFGGDDWEQKALEWVKRFYHNDYKECEYIKELNTSALLDICAVADVWELGE